jgi:hypothetical protein
MHPHPYPRLLLIGFLFAFVTMSAIHSNAGAEGLRERTNTTSQEDTLAATCPGLDLKTSYLVKTSNHIVEDYPGHTAIDSQHVTFEGAIGNGLEDSSYGYDGFYTRTADHIQDKVWISDLLLHFGTGTPKAVSVSLAHADFDLSDNPAVAIQTLVTNVLQTDFCGLVGGPASTLDWGVAPFSPPSSGIAPNNIDTNEPLQNLKPSQPGTGCSIEQRKGYPCQV